MLTELLEGVPKWLIMLAGLLLSAVIGYLDYLTGDYSILIFYMIPVGFVSWFGGRRGVVVAVSSGFARYLSDYHQYDNPMKHYWNSLEDMLFLIFAGLLVHWLKQALEK